MTSTSPTSPTPSSQSSQSSPSTPSLPVELPGYVHVYSGKVRDLYAPVGPDGRARDDQLLLVASDRLSAYDWVLDSPIPDKGKVLTLLSLWWFDQFADIVPNHVLSTDVPEAVSDRAVLVQRLEMVPIEAVARWYLAGGGLEEYRASGLVSGVPLPEGLVEASKLADPIFTPSTKAPMGEHDLPMTPDEVEAKIGRDLAVRVSDVTREILRRGNKIAADRGIIIADTKVEFGLDPAGELVLADEILTPDSSRFWPADQWQPGRQQPSYDKQFVRDWLTSSASGWSKSSGEAPPPLPADVIEQTRTKYIEAYERLTGRTF